MAVSIDWGSVFVGVPIPGGSYVPNFLCGIL